MGVRLDRGVVDVWAVRFEQAPPGPTVYWFETRGRIQESEALTSADTAGGVIACPNRFDGLRESEY